MSGRASQADWSPGGGGCAPAAPDRSPLVTQSKQDKGIRIWRRGLQREAESSCFRPGGRARPRGLSPPRHPRSERELGAGRLPPPLPPRLVTGAVPRLPRWPTKGPPLTYLNRQLKRRSNCQKIQGFSGFFGFFVFSCFFSLFRNSLFRLFCFYTETESFDVSIELKQTEDPPKQFKREYIQVFFRKFRVVSVVSIQVRNTETNRIFLFLVLRNKPKQTRNRSCFGLFRFEPKFIFVCFEDTLFIIQYSVLR